MGTALVIRFIVSSFMGLELFWACRHEGFTDGKGSRGIHGVGQRELETTTIVTLALGGDLQLFTEFDGISGLGWDTLDTSGWTGRWNRRVRIGMRLVSWFAFLG